MLANQSTGFLHTRGNDHHLPLRLLITCLMFHVVQTVPAAQVTQLAKPLPKQYIDKGKVWVAFIGGAASLFIATVLLENNAAWFPAIKKANEAMSGQPNSEEQQAEVGASTWWHFHDSCLLRQLLVNDSCRTALPNPVIPVIQAGCQHRSLSA